MPIPQETIAEPAVPTSDIPKIKEKALPTSDSAAPNSKPVVKEVEAPAIEVKQKEAAVEVKQKEAAVEVKPKEAAVEKEEATKPAEKKDELVEGNGKASPSPAEEKTVEKTEDKPVEVAKEAVDVEKKSEEKPSEEPKPDSADSAQTPSTPKKSDGASSAMTENPDLTPKKAEAFNLLAQGKRHYFVKDYESAVETLGEVCEKFSAIYGETGTEMGDVYYYYGISLLELAREEANLLNVDKDDKKDGEEDEEEDEEMEEEQQDDGKPGGGVGEKKIGEEGEEKDGAAEEKKEDGKVEGADDSAVDETLKEGEATMEEEDVNNLQLAWEMLELSRSIYFKVGNELKLADIYLKLSEVSMESENYAAAIEDIEKGLAVYVKELSKDHRNIAEAHYKLGMAHANNDNYPEAVKQFELSKETLLARVENLKTSDKPDAELSKEPFYKKDSEIKELEALLPEINARIEECNSDNKEIKKVISNFISGKKPVSDDGAGPSSAVDTGSSGAASSTSSKPASDISHLVKKKRKPEEAVEKTEVVGKKIKLDEPSANDNQESETTASTAEDVDMKAKQSESNAAESGKSTAEDVDMITKESESNPADTVKSAHSNAAESGKSTDGDVDMEAKKSDSTAADTGKASDE